MAALMGKSYDLCYDQEVFSLFFSWVPGDWISETSVIALPINYYPFNSY